MATPTRTRPSEHRIPSPRQYFNRKHAKKITTSDLPLEINAIGVFSPAGVFFTCVKLTVPLAYIYIVLILWRELCFTFPGTLLEGRFVDYFPLGAWAARTMRGGSRGWAEAWAVLEGVFYVVLGLHRRWLNSLDTLELSLRSAPMLEARERAELWELMMDSERGDCAEWITGWFFGEALEKLTRIDVLAFLAWSLFEGRNTEHLTREETQQLHRFLSELEYQLSIELHGVQVEEMDGDETQTVGMEYEDKEEEEEEEGEDEGKEEEEDAVVIDEVADNKPRVAIHPPPSFSQRQRKMQNYGSSPGGRDSEEERIVDRKGTSPKPKKVFQFVTYESEESSYFSNLYEKYTIWCEHYREMVDKPVQDIRNYMAEKRQSFQNAEKSAVAAASESLGGLYESLHNAEQSAVAAASESLGGLYESFHNAEQLAVAAVGGLYERLVEPDGALDRRLVALNHGTRAGLDELWSSAWEMPARLRTASALSSRRRALRNQLEGYRRALEEVRGGSLRTAIQSKQMAELMRRITKCYEALEGVEASAKDAFLQITGFVVKKIHKGKEPPRYLNYSCDPLMDVASYPLMFHLLILFATDGGLRVMLYLRGFSRLRVGGISYYHHPGNSSSSNNQLTSFKHGDNNDHEESNDVPIVFCHGIGVGLIFYMTLIDELMKLGRPILLPEIPYVSGFRPWQAPHCVLPPAAVTSTLMSILACHGHSRGAFFGHSYGTSWVSFMCKYAPSAVAAVLFLDPVCFQLHCARLTRSFVYHRADPGSTSHMIRTDVNINWTIQRGFPWARISLFTEQIPCVPCAVFLSEIDALVPSAKVIQYMRRKGAVVLDSCKVSGRDHFLSFSTSSHPINVTIFRGQGHGDWPLVLSANRQVAQAAGALVGQIRPVAHDEYHSY